ncbi:hypothetical protein [Sphingorhabdus sp. 109]|jgi:hypothetical protein|uniref:hypothetical protein n=1 Tax=Sphingorhabdus sp. 109 TaxID=2653173 RepID=UPI0012EFC6B6|nr:hypothetical protein [Sphingorhabdus sp. 109]VWX60824.1 hypothetical protein SPHINGOR109_50798 [Sphingorhabdus sp. 109]
MFRAFHPRHCERSEAIQSGMRASWIATSPAASRNDGAGNIAFLRGFVASCESNFGAQRHEGTKSFPERVLVFILKALCTVVSPSFNPSAEEKLLEGAVGLKGRLV